MPIPEKVSSPSPLRRCLTPTCLPSYPAGVFELAEGGREAELKELLQGAPPDLDLDTPGKHKGGREGRLIMTKLGMGRLSLATPGKGEGWGGRGDRGTV